MKTLKPIMAVILTAFFAISIISCSDTNHSGEFDDSYWNYIEIPHNTDFNNLSTKERDILKKAANRFKTIENEFGLYELIVRNAKEAKVSENIYLYFAERVKRSNEYLLYYASPIKLRLLTRSENYEDYKYVNDCLAWAVANATGLDYNYISRYYFDYYGPTGVPVEKVEEAINHFKDCVPFDPNNIPNGVTLPKNSIIILKDESKRHAVNGVEIDDNGNLIFHDYQYDAANTTQGHPEYEISRDKILIIYFI